MEIQIELYIEVKAGDAWRKQQFSLGFARSRPQVYEWNATPALGVKDTHSPEPPNSSLSEL